MIKQDKDCLLSMIEEEIKWCEDNSDASGEGEHFEFGFIQGLRQAIVVVKAYCDILEQNDEMDSE